jgi:hypothetical protein
VEPVQARDLFPLAVSDLGTGELAPMEDAVGEPAVMEGVIGDISRDGFRIDSANGNAFMRQFFGLLLFVAHKIVNSFFFDNKDCELMHSSVRF